MHPLFNGAILGNSGMVQEFQPSLLLDGSPCVL